MVSLVRYIKYFFLWGLLFVLFGQVDSYAQQLKVFSVESVEDDPFDMSANAKAATKKVDGSGDLYAILKITSDDVDDDLRAYNFDFGMLKSIVEVHDAEGEIWVYVQKNAKQVTITRSGYRTVSRYDLQRTFEPGKVYRMKISVKKEVAVVGKGTLLFKITPAKAGTMVTYTNSQGVKSLFGTTDASGQVAKYIELGTYTFSVVAEYYHESEGRVKLESANGTHIEEVTLRPNFADVELVAASGADIYVDGQKKGTSSWKGILGPGTYQIECRCENHRPTSKYVEVKDGEQYKFALDAPVPIVGTLVLMSSPLGASVKIDGKDYGVTPLTLDSLLIGSHSVAISKSGYDALTKTINIKEGETVEENAVLVEAVSYSYSVAEARTTESNGHEYVDLGLPSGLKWATCNVGASSPEEYGDYYAWGEIEIKGEYSNENSKARGKSIGDISGNSNYDVARAKWGGNWRMPTMKELEELNSKCTWQWTTQKGINGYKVTGPNGNSIFLPAAGCREGSSLDGVERDGFYWSSTPDDSNYYDCLLIFSSSYHNVDMIPCYSGLSVRPVLGNQNESNRVNGYEYVDLGLPSGLKWATCNVGADSPEDYGDYYAWGEIETKGEYYESNSKTYGKSISGISGSSTYDVARAKWGGSWRLPTKKELEELKNNCKWQWTSQNGKKGYKVTGPNGNSIFMPAAGNRYGSSLYDAGEYGLYWSSTPYESNDSNTYSLDFDSSYHYVNWIDRYLGQSVRPVLGNQNESNKINGYEYVDLGLPSGLKWATCNVGASSQEEYGDYYAWGEIDTKSEYTGANSKTYSKSMSDISGNAMYDVARAKWGGSWRLPTKKELEELESKCKCEWTTQNGKKGYKVTGPNGKSIFLPAAGYRIGSSLYGAGEEGYYWSSPPYVSNDDGAYRLYFRSSYRNVSWNYRHSGQSVRPVSE